MPGTVATLVNRRVFSLTADGRHKGGDISSATRPQDGNKATAKRPQQTNKENKEYKENKGGNTSPECVDIRTSNRLFPKTINQEHQRVARSDTLPESPPGRTESSSTKLISPSIALPARGNSTNHRQGQKALVRHHFILWI